MSAAYASHFEAVLLCTHPKRPKMSYAAAACYMKKSEGFVRKWEKWYNSTKNVDDILECGSRRSLTESHDKAIFKLFQKHAKCSLRRAKNILLKKGILLV